MQKRLKRKGSKKVDDSRGESKDDYVTESAGALYSRRKESLSAEVF